MRIIRSRKFKTLVIQAFFAAISMGSFAQAVPGSTNQITDPKALLQTVTARFSILQSQCIRPAEGYIKYDYLIPAGFYKQMWDWDGFFIGCHLASESRDHVKYLKYWVLDFANSVDSAGYVAGCITTKGPRSVFGKFSMKPFICQGAYLVSKWLNDFSWISPAVYNRMRLIISYRESTQFDARYRLFFWDNAMQSGADNTVTLTNDKNDPGAILGADINTFQLREYISMGTIASKLGHVADAVAFQKKAANLKKAMMKYLWFAGDHSFFNIRRDNGMPLKRISYSNFVPLMEGEGLLSGKEGRAMIKKYLWNEDHMLTPFGLRSLSKQDSDYNNKAIIIPYSNWQGPVWIIADYLYFTALKKYGFDKEAGKLSVMLGNLVLRDINSCGSMHEDYNADTGAPLAPTAEQSEKGLFTGFVGWNLLVQDMLEETQTNKPLLLDLDY